MVQQSSRLNHPLYRPLSRWFMKLFSRGFETIGADNFPEPPLVAISNHLSFFDALAYGGADLPFDMAVLAAKKYKGKLVGSLLEFFVKPIYIEQDAPDHSALKEALSFLKSGLPISVAPEGHRSRVGALIQAREGTAYLLRKANVPIVPMAVIGTHLISKTLRPLVQVRIGKPYFFEPVSKISKEQLKEDTERLMCSIAALLPESYHGLYQGHPLIEEMKAIVC